MRDKYWAMYHQMKFSEYYYSHYLSLTVVIDRCISAFTCLVSAAGVASWWIWKSLGVAWAVLVGVSQAISAIRHLLPYSKRMTSLGFLTPAMSQLLNEISRDWSRIDYSSEAVSNDEIINLIYEYECRYAGLLSKHLGAASLPDNKYCIRKAADDQKSYFRQRYGLNFKTTTDSEVIV